MIPYANDGKVTGLNHFGSKGENPDGYADLKKSLHLLRKSVPEDEVWAYDADGFADEFQQVLVHLGVDEETAEWPDDDDMFDAGFESVDLHGDTRYFMKPGVSNVVVVVDTNPGGAPAMVVLSK